ncbi:hypothetical protein Ciccas_007818 [Cichlidogyrus casuarinus]|uniref:Uncharacterized protein n=1 Tax=Cichlidogyrus casuarinus TaxID=1844966 RepID=A0ABD2Q2G4_9PLAT
MDTDPLVRKRFPMIKLLGPRRGSNKTVTDYETLTRKSLLRSSPLQKRASSLTSSPLFDAPKFAKGCRTTGTPESSYCVVERRPVQFLGQLRSPQVSGFYSLLFDQG